MYFWLVFLFLIFCFLFFLGWKIKKILNFYLYPPRISNDTCPEDYQLSYEKFKLFVNDDTIVGWFFPGKEKLAIIFVPGFITNKSFILKKAIPLLRQKKFSFVIFDPRGQGESSGQFLMGAFVDEEIEAIIKWLKEKKKINKIVLFGISLGATIAIKIAGTRKDILAVIADSPFVNVYKISTKEVFKLPPLIIKIFLPLARLFLLIKFKKDLFKKLDALSVVDKVSNIFFIHGKNDKTYSCRHSQILFEKAKTPKKIWLNEAGHCKSFELYPKEYLAKIFSFFQEIGLE